MDDEFGRRTIEDLLPRNWPRLFHVGRLDMDSEGLLLLTNDGELSQKLTHPKHLIEKEYEVLLDKPYDSELTAKLQRGIVLEQGRAKIERLQIVKPKHVRVVLAQGLKRQIRLMFAAIGYEVIRLCRTRIGPIRLGALPSGSYRLLTDRELRLIHEHLNQKPTIERVHRPDRQMA
jgi:23S rRNA pseudouridine2605 synthase